MKITRHQLREIITEFWIPIPKQIQGSAATAASISRGGSGGSHGDGYYDDYDDDDYDDDDYDDDSDSGIGDGDGNGD